MGDDLVIALIPGQNRAQHDAIIIPPRFRIKERDLKVIRCGVGQILQHPPSPCPHR